jgi:cytochrome c biogenesis protein CcmG/thiol:disulfide interchange protein DsbE
MATGQAQRRWGLWGLLVALVLLAGLMALLARGLSLNPRELPSALVGKPIPMAALQALPQVPVPRASTGQPTGLPELAGKVWVLNVWASWCASCRDEHGLLMSVAKPGSVPIVGLAYKDKPDDSVAWLRRLGNPYAFSLDDATGRAGVELGVYGVPETFVIDQSGVVRHRSTGALTPQRWAEVVAPLVAGLQAGPADATSSRGLR